MSSSTNATRQQFVLFERLGLWGSLRIFAADALGKPRLQLVHGIGKYPGPLAQHSPNRDKSFGYLDDIEGESGELVLVDADMMLSQTTASRVLSLEHHMAELDTNQQRPSIPASELIHAHKAFFVPFELVPFLLGKGLSPCQTMGILHPQLNHGGLVGTCTLLFDTLRVAGTAPTVPAGDPILTNYMKHKVMYRDLPSLTLKDSLELQKTKAYILVDWTEVDTTQLESYVAVLATIIGLNHDVVTSYQQVLSRFKIQQMPLRRAIADEVGELLTPAIVVYHFQIRVRGWLEEQWEAASPIPSPDFGANFHTFQMSQNLNWLPNVSNVAALRLLRRFGPPPSPTKAGAKGPSTNNNTSNNHSSSPGTRLVKLTDSNQPLVKKLESSKMEKAPSPDLMDKKDATRGISKESVSAAVSTYMTMWPSPPASKTNSGSGAKRHMPEMQASAIYLMALRHPTQPQAEQEGDHKYPDRIIIS
eukprot:jgi/Psemu1/21042/gm1.21042_g